MRKEKNRLDALYSYQILDTPPETELDELAEIASLICNVPIALITFIDENRQWYKAKKGLNTDGVKRKDSFCQHLLNEPKEILVVEDAQKDFRFIDNPSVKASPNIRFYAGVPLESPNGDILGTLCVVDYAPKSISENQKKVLQILAKKTMDYLNVRKILLEQKNYIENNAERLKKLTDNVPSGIIQMKMSTAGVLSTEFIGKGMLDLYPNLSLEQWRESPEIYFSIIHPDDLKNFNHQLAGLFKNNSMLQIEYRVKIGSEYRWHSASGNSEKMADGSITLYLIKQDINDRIEYELAMEQIAFDISHVLRRPVTTLLGLNDLIERENNISRSKMLEYVGYIKTVSKEMDAYTRSLNEIYQKKRELIISSTKVNNTSDAH